MDIVERHVRRHFQRVFLAAIGSDRAILSALNHDITIRPLDQDERSAQGLLGESGAGAQHDGANRNEYGGFHGSLPALTIRVKLSRPRMVPAGSEAWRLAPVLFLTACGRYRNAISRIRRDLVTQRP